MENALTTSQPVGTRVALMTANQEIIQAEVSESSSGGGGFSDSATVGLGGELTTPKVLTISTDPDDFASVVVTGWVTISWLNNESSPTEASGTITFEISTDSGVTWSSIGDPLGYTVQNPALALVQQSFVNVPFTTRATGPATGSVQVRATILDQTTGATLAGGQFTATGCFFP